MRLVVEWARQHEAELAANRIFDGGADGVGDTTADNTVFLRPGIFIP